MFLQFLLRFYCASVIVCKQVLVVCVFFKHCTLTFQYKMKMFFIVFRQATEDEDVLSSLKAKNENLESELSSLLRKMEEQDKLNSSYLESLNSLKVEKKRLEELVAQMRNKQQQKDGDGSVEVVKEQKAQSAELKEKLASFTGKSALCKCLASDGDDAELTTVYDEKHHLDKRITYLEQEVQRHKDAEHEQRIRALDLKHELREVLFMLLFILISVYSVTLPAVVS